MKANDLYHDQECVTLTELGEIFGVSRDTMLDWMQRLDMYSSDPGFGVTTKALEGGFVDNTPAERWFRNRCVEMLKVQQPWSKTPRKSPRPKRPAAKKRPAKIKPVLAIGLSDGKLTIAVLNPARFTRHVAWLLRDIKAGEVLTSRAALDAIAAASPRSGVVPMDIGSILNTLGIMAWTFPTQYLSVQPGAIDWFRECCTVDDTATALAIQKWASQRDKVLAKIKEEK